MKAANFAYARAADVAHAIELLSGNGTAKLLGGSQSLGPMLNLRLARPSELIDIAQIEDLRVVRAHGDVIEIGAAVTHAELEEGVHPPLVGHPVQGVAAGIAYRAIRTRGTIGGSLAHADPAADWVVSLAALGARVRLRSRGGERMVEADSLLVGAYTTVLAADELIVAVAVPVPTPAARWGYHKLCRKTGEFAEASAACFFDLSRHCARVVLGAVDGPPILLRGLAAHLGDGATQGLTREQVKAAVKQALPERDAIDLRLFAAALERALQQAGVTIHHPLQGASN